MIVSEKAVEDYLENHLDVVDSKIKANLKLVPGGRQYSTTVGPIDLLTIDTKTGDYVVIELKKGRSADKVYGQCSRYMGWVRKNLAAAGAKVHGVIVARQIDDKLKAARDAHDTKVHLIEFEMKIGATRLGASCAHLRQMASSSMSMVPTASIGTSRRAEPPTRTISANNSGFSICLKARYYDHLQARIGAELRSNGLTTAGTISRDRSSGSSRTWVYAGWRKASRSGSRLPASCISGNRPDVARCSTSKYGATSCRAR